MNAQMEERIYGRKNRPLDEEGDLTSEFTEDEK
jgi:hypothetical protein